MFISVAEPVVLPAVMPGDSFAVPLHLTSWRLQARPKGMGVFFCKAPIHWTNVVKTAEVSSSKRECHSMETEKSRFFRYVLPLQWCAYCLPFSPFKVTFLTVFCLRTPHDLIMLIKNPKVFFFF